VRIIDRFMLDRARLSLFAALGSEIAGWFLFGPVGASVCGTFVVAIGLASVYGTLAKSGEFTAIVAAGIAPRRAICSIVAGVVLICTIEAVLACTVRVPAVRSECAVDVFAAIVPAVAASIVLPIAIRTRTDEPWAFVFLLLLAYTLAIAAGTIMEHAGVLTPGTFWSFIDCALFAADALLFRIVFYP
jgi:hypothetical protein